jgi:ADP-ribose pyrophosphatase
MEINICLEGDEVKDNRIKSLTPLAETQFLSLYDAEYKNRSGKEKHWIIASRKNFCTLKEQFFQGKKEEIDAVIIAALHRESKSLVLIRQFRIPLNDYVYELPAGLVDGSEGIEEAVGRELKEETGLKLLEINNDKTKNRVYASAGMTDEAVAMVYCICEGTVTNEYMEEDEDIEPMLITQQEAREMLRKDVKIDIRAYLTLLSFAELGESFFGL